jgi:vacuolar-type H+-ATPase subunit I/STV1
MADVAEVEVKSAFLSKINWTQLISVLASLLVVFGVNIPPELQAHIAAAITAVSAIATIVMKTWFTTTVTPSSATKV